MPRADLKRHHEMSGPAGAVLSDPGAQPVDMAGALLMFGSSVAAVTNPDLRCVTGGPSREEQRRLGARIGESVHPAVKRVHQLDGPARETRWASSASVVVGRPGEPGRTGS